MIRESAFLAGDLGSIPGSGRSPGEGNTNPLWYSCLEDPVDRGAWRATVHGVGKSQTGLTTEHTQVAKRMSRWPSLRPALSATQEINRELAKTLSPDSDFTGLQTHGNFWKDAQVIQSAKSRLRTSDQIGLSALFAITLTTLVLIFGAGETWVETHSDGEMGQECGQRLEAAISENVQPRVGFRVT